MHAMPGRSGTVRCMGLHDGCRAYASAVRHGPRSSHAGDDGAQQPPSHMGSHARHSCQMACSGGCLDLHTSFSATPHPGWIVDCWPGHNLSLAKPAPGPSRCQLPPVFLEFVCVCYTKIAWSFSFIFYEAPLCCPAPAGIASCTRCPLPARNTSPSVAARVVGLN